MIRAPYSPKAHARLHIANRDIRQVWHNFSADCIVGRRKGNRWFSCHLGNFHNKQYRSEILRLSRNLCCTGYFVINKISCPAILKMILFFREVYSYNCIRCIIILIINGSLTTHNIIFQHPVALRYHFYIISTPSIMQQSSFSETSRPPIRQPSPTSWTRWTPWETLV
jgi:hypothetical protein